MKIKTKLLILIGLGLVFVLFYILNSPHRMQRIAQYFQQDIEAFVRASIITDDNVTLAYSENVYHLSLLNGALNEDEFSELMDKISTVIPINKEKRAYSYFKNPKVKEYVIIAYGINQEQTEKIKTILKDEKYYAFTLSGEKRIYPYTEMLTPFVGYNKKGLSKDFTYLEGVQGVEGYYDSTLSSQKKAKPENIVLNIDFDLQQRKEQELDEMKLRLSAEEVISVVLNTETFAIKSAASSNRYNPKDIRREDFKNLSVHTIQYMFNIDDFILPINEAISHENNLALENGYEKFGLYDKSGIDLKHEVVAKNSENIKVNFMQLVKAYAVFYANGKIASPSIAKQNISQTIKQIISKENALEVKQTLPAFFEKMKEKKLLLEFEDYNATASIYMNEFETEDEKYLQAYFVVDNK